MRLSKNKTIIAAIILAAMLGIFAESLSFDAGVTIGDGGSVQNVSQIGKIAGITCQWNYSSDVTNMTLEWYNGSNLYLNKTFTSDVYEDTLSASKLGVGDNWNCTVTIINSTGNTRKQSASIEIIYDPGVYINTTTPYTYINNQNQTIYEDKAYTLVWNTSLPDDPGFYSISGSGSSACSGGVSSTYGERYCSFDDLYLGSDLNTSGSTSIVFQYKNPDYFPYNEITFTVMPVNDAPTTDATTATMNQGDGISIQINISDREGNFPMNFTMTETPNFCTNTNTTSTITFNCNPGESIKGNFSINFTLIDNPPNNGFGLIPAETNETFTLQVLEVNHYPNITYYTNHNSSQGLYYNITFGATDRFDNSTLNFSIIPSCSITNPWSDITTSYFDYTDGNVTTNGTGYWNGTLTNNHIICRNVTLIVRDEGGLNDTVNILLNISNTNDAPTINNYSADQRNSVNNNYIYNLTGYVSAPFTYWINITDPDLDVTYDSSIDSFEESLTITSNDSAWLNNYISSVTWLIDIDSEGMNISTGNYTFMINVSDSGTPAKYNTTIMNLQIKNNTIPQFNQTLNFSNCSEYDEDNHPYNCYINISQYTYDPDSAIGDNVSSFSDNSPIFDITEDGIINFTATQAMVGMQNYSITIEDTRGATNTKPIYIYINNTNNPPNITDIESRDSGIVLQVNNANNNKIEITVSDFDLNLTGSNPTDLDYAYEILNFTWQNNNATQALTPYISIEPNLTSDTSSIYLVINTTTTNSTNGTLEAGTYSINVTVQDGYLNYSGISTQDTDVYRYNFEVYGTILGPVIENVTPYGEPYSSTTVFNQSTIIGGSDTYTIINTTENNSRNFEVEVRDLNGDAASAKFYWYYDGVLLNSTTTGINHNSSAVIHPNNNSLNFTFGFFETDSESGYTTHDLNLTVIDAVSNSLSDSFSWRINVIDVNRDITFNSSNPIPDITFTDSTTPSADENLWEIDDVFGFYDPDYDYDGNGAIEKDEKNFTITYSIAYTDCTAYATINVSSPYATSTYNNNSIISGHGITATAIQNGTCQLYLQASDGEDTELSNYINVTVIKTSADESSTTESSTTGSSGSGSSSSRTEVIEIPMPEEIDKPIPIEIILPDMVTVYENNTIDIPLTITNTWNQAVEGVRLDYEIGNSTYNYTVRFKRSSFYAIQPGEKIKTMMTVFGYRVGGVYELIVIANVTNPPYVDSAKIYLNSIEQSSTGAQVKTLIRFAQDLLHKNKECQELGEILNEAENLRQEGKLDESLELVDSVINGCQFLISQDQMVEVPKSFRKIHFPLKQEYLIYLLIAATLIMGIFGGYQFFKKKE